MKPLLIAATLLLAMIFPANATSTYPPDEGPFFAAWALTKVCPNLSFNEAGRYMVTVKTLDRGISGKSRNILRQAMPWANHLVDYHLKIVTDPNACSKCQAYDAKEDDVRGGSSPCRYLQSSDWPEPWLSNKH